MARAEPDRRARGDAVESAALRFLEANGLRLLARNASARGGELDLVDQRWHGDTVYSPGLIDLARRQHTRTARVALTYPVGDRSILQLEWRGAFDRENISIFQYDARQLHLSWQWYGGK